MRRGRQRTEAALIPFPAHSVHMVHDDSSSSTSPFELEMTWVGPQTKGVHQHVPEETLREAVAAARSLLDAGMDED